MPTGRRSVDALESCTQELGALCGGLDAQQFKDECDEDVSEQDTLASLEEMAGECAALLACFEAEENRSGELVDDEEVTNAENSNNEKNHQLPQEEEPDESGPLKAGLAHELDSFADELNEFLVCWKESNTEESATNINVYLCPSEGRSSEEEMPKNEEIVDAIDPPVTSNAATDNSVIIGEADEENLLENIVEEMSKQKWQSCTDDESKVNKEAPAASTNIPDAHLTNDEAHTANLANTTEVISERTKNAIALHVKRMELQKKQRFGAPSKLWLSQTTNEKDQQIPTEQNHSPGVRVPWSKFQRSSFQQHITRQMFARRRVKQLRDAQRLVETARLKGSKRRRPKINYHKASKPSAQNASYLGQFKPCTVHFVASSECEPKCLCAVYLYGLRRLGTTYITFSSLAQLEHRVRSRFAIDHVVSIYREVTELVFPESALRYCNSRKRHVKRLKRVSTLEQLNDGDTLCVTQNAYDDMDILCDWIKQRQRIVHDFQYTVQQCPTDVSSDFTDERTIPSKPKVSNKPQLWDSNGRSIGVQAKQMG
ncbi:hypothetical protein GN958_ATG10990 [Phytophthora infestans]|uniref:Uncharacterized protein n=1 Tax=Phytophthora infestans TaxID=4787 RepID=A0A8S9UKZ6_PHYIN|nr:hypothetical protein GN958_ATG10990 [Phytophthora infestans]